MKVLATGMRSISAKRTNASAAPWRMTPLPASITGNFASEMILAACSILKSGAARGVRRLHLDGRSLDLRISAMFSGKSMNAAAGLFGLRDLERLAHDLGHDFRLEDLGRSIW